MEQSEHQEKQQNFTIFVDDTLDFHSPFSLLYSFFGFFFSAKINNNPVVSPRFGSSLI